MAPQTQEQFFVRYRPMEIPGRGRLTLVMIGFGLFFALIAVRLVNLGAVPEKQRVVVYSNTKKTVISRPDIVDRNGHLLATDIKTSSVYADPKKIIDVDDMVEKLSGVLDGLDVDRLRKRLSNKKRRFVYIKRGLSPAQHAVVHDLGIPGLSFVRQPHRVYPIGRLMSHVLGYVDVDNKGQAGIERYLDSVAGVYFPKVHQAGAKPVLEVSLDLGVQHIMRSELAAAMSHFKAKAAAGIVMDVTSGEVLAMTSLPDFDPHVRTQALDKNRIDRIAHGVFELGSIFKVVTTAMALDTGTANISTTYDASEPIRINGQTINDYHGKGRPLTVREIFKYSSNIGSAKMAVDVGASRQQAFLRKLGLLEPMKTEIGLMQAPLKPRPWKKVSTMTVAYGHGLSVSPLQFSAATASLVNGGYYVKPTFLKRSRAKGREVARKVIKVATSNEIRELLRLNVLQGTGKRADAKGYRVGGKTGTAEKVIKGKYHKSKLLTTFVSVFPTDDPAYVILVMLDEPQQAPGQTSRPTAGTNVALVTKRLIAKIGSKLGVAPQ